MPSLLSFCACACAGLCLTLGLASSLTAAEPVATTVAEHVHLQRERTHSKLGYITRWVTCTEIHPAPPTAPEHTHRWFKSGDKRPGQWITETCTQVHPQSRAKVCPNPSPKGGCAHKPGC